MKVLTDFVSRESLLSGSQTTVLSSFCYILTWWKEQGSSLGSLYKGTYPIRDSTTLMT